MLSWAVWLEFLFTKVIANTCLFTLTSFSKQSASWKILEICEMCALSTDSQKTYSVNILVAAATASTGGITEKTPDMDLEHQILRKVPIKYPDRCEGTNTASKVCGADDVEVPKAPVSRLITVSIQLYYIRTCATQVFFLTCELLPLWDLLKIKVFRSPEPSPHGKDFI